MNVSTKFLDYPPNFVSVYPVHVEIFHRISENLNLMVALEESQSTTKVTKIPLPSGLNIIRKCEGITNMITIHH